MFVNENIFTIICSSYYSVKNMQNILKLASELKIVPYKILIELNDK